MQDSTKRDLLKKAVDKHIQLMKEAKANAGCDRHLLGLYLIAVEQGEEVPELFRDPAFIRR
jgi:carnitine O-octanoyltransferase